MPYPRLRRSAPSVAGPLLKRLGLALLLLAAADHFVFSYVRLLDAADDARPGHADAIVAFSGDPARIKRGFELLAQGAAPRLFIAGLDNGTDIETERKRLPHLSQCCVEVDNRSANTHQDARAVAAWTRSRGSRSLIVVTTNIHMPRAMAELNGTIPDVALTPVGVSQGLYDTRDWRHNAAIRPRLAREAAKYALVRLGNLFGLLGLDMLGVDSAARFD